MVSTQGNDLHVRPEGRYLDQHEAPALITRILEELKAEPARLVLDLSDIHYLDSSGMAMLVALRRLRPSLESMVLQGLTPAVAEQIRISRQLKALLEGGRRDEAADETKARRAA